jgi:hypothetical protein
MTARTKYFVGTAFLGVAIVILIVEILGMTGVLPKYIATRQLNLTAIIFLVIASGMRRRARTEMGGQAPRL